MPLETRKQSLYFAVTFNRENLYIKNVCVDLVSVVNSDSLIDNM